MAKVATGAPAGAPDRAAAAAAAAVAAGSAGSAGGTSAGSIYTELLNAVLSEEEAAPAMSTSESLAELVRARRKVVWTSAVPTDPGWSDVALAEQLAYDSSLIRYARMVGIDCHPGNFRIPGAERRRLERTLVSRGIHLVT